MTKKTILVILLVSFSFGSLIGQSSLVSAYKSGKIVLDPDPRFGRGVDGASVVLNFANDMTVAPDGSIFVANNREHTILKFGANGRLIGKFGRKGQGRGDFEFPCNLGILNGRVLIVGEYAEGGGRGVRFRRHQAPDDHAEARAIPTDKGLPAPIQVQDDTGS